jgi:hypothetical protein
MIAGDFTVGTLNRTSVMSNQLTRRDILKLGAASLVGLAFRDFPPGNNPMLAQAPAFPLGRTVYSMRYYASPTTSSQEKGFYVTDSVVDLREQMVGDPRPTHNPLWLRTDDGWIPSAYVQPVRNELNTPVNKVPDQGMLVEVTVPFTQAWMISDRGWRRVYRCYYGSTYWANFVFTNDSGSTWYQFYDERAKENFYFDARHLRPVTAEEMTPISAGMADKHIEIDLTNQRLTAYENDQPVFTARTATGRFEGDTPQGGFRVERKQPTRHMASNTPGSAFDLPGVPWVCYIAWTGVSFHGTYWHNNYGTPQSHGCINLTPEAARWIYRWTEPVVPFGEDYVESDAGTRVVVY